jgi:manganese/zinc/iron transport system substrate-binding protein
MSAVIRKWWCVFLLVGCGTPAPAPHAPVELGPRPITIARPYTGAGPIKVVCTTGMVADVVRAVGGARVSVNQLMGAGVDPHLYKAAPGDVSQLTAADIVFYNGLHLEGKMGEVFANLSKSKPTFAVAEYLPPAQLLANPEGGFDPHVWFDVALWRETVTPVVAALAAFDPPHAADYRQRGEAYRTKLDRTHEYVKNELSRVPGGQRILVTAHDAFRYFGRAYGVEVRGLQGISTECDIGLREVNELVEFLTTRKIKAVFVETSVPDKSVQALIEGCARRMHTVRIGGELYSDALGEPGTPAGTYAGMVRHNVDTLVQALR